VYVFVCARVCLCVWVCVCKFVCMCVCACCVRVSNAKISLLHTGPQRQEGIKKPYLAEEELGRGIVLGQAHSSKDGLCCSLRC